MGGYSGADPNAQERLASEVVAFLETAYEEKISLDRSFVIDSSLDNVIGSTAASTHPRQRMS